MRRSDSKLTAYSGHMRTGMWVVFGLAGAITLGAIGLMGPVPAEGQVNTVATIFQGDPAQDGGITLSSWGSGSIKEDTRTAFGNGKNSLKITTHGYYQGGSIVFNTPVDLGSYLTDKNAYLQFALLLQDNNSSRQGFPGYPGGGGLAGNPGGFPGGQGFPGGAPPGLGGFPGGAPPGAPGFPGFGRGGPGRSGFGMYGSTQTQVAQPLQNLRLVMVTAGGKELEMQLPISYAITSNQWKLLSIPVAAIPGMTSDDAKIKAVRLFGDQPTTFYLGKIGVIVDNTPIQIQPMDEQVVGMRQTYLYTARASAGATPIVISWDWDASDGIQDEQQGRSVRHLYPKAGDYVATVTASDPFNIKQPAKMTFKVHVHQ